MRLKSEIWAMAHVRRVFTEGATAVIVRKGDKDAGSIYIRTRHFNGATALFGPAPEPLGSEAGERFWRLLLEEQPLDLAAGEPMAGGFKHKIDDRLRREAEFDPDIWVIEIDDREGRHFLGAHLVGADE